MTERAPVIPQGKLFFIATETGFMDARALPGAGLALRADGDLVVIGGGEAFAARLTPDDMEILAAVLTRLAAEHRQAVAAVTERLNSMEISGHA